MQEITVGTRRFMIREEDPAGYLSAYEVDAQTGQIAERGIGLGQLGDFNDPAVKVQVLERLTWLCNRFI